MKNRIQEFLQTLDEPDSSAENRSTRSRILRDAEASLDVTFLKQLLEAIPTRHREIQAHVWRLMLSINSLEATRAVLIWFQKKGQLNLDKITTRWSFGAVLAIHLVQFQSIETLETLVSEAGQDPEFQDVFDCWIQESILRGQDFRKNAAINSYWQAGQAAGRMLCWLPLHRYAIESDQPGYASRLDDDRQVSWGRSYDIQSSARIKKVPQSEQTLQGFTDLPQDEARRCLDLAMFDCPEWVEFKVFRLATPLVKLQPEILRSLPIGYLVNDDPRDPLDVSRLQTVEIEATPLTPNELVNQLMALAVNRGAYNTVFIGSRARYYVWKNLAALVGADPGVSTDILERMVIDSQWIYFKPDTYYFMGVIDDTAVACLRPDRESVAILAYAEVD